MLRCTFARLKKTILTPHFAQALCGLFNNDEVLNHAIEFTGTEETMKSLAVDDRLAIANMTTVSKGTFSFSSNKRSDRLPLVLSLTPRGNADQALCSGVGRFVGFIPG